MQGDLKDLKKGCPYGKAIADGIGDGDNTPVVTRVAALETDVATLKAALDAVLKATADKEGYTLQMTNDAKVKLVNVV